MGIRGEIFSTKLLLQNRTYFFNVKENRLGDLYLNIVESKNKDSGGFERQSVIVFTEDLSAFLGEFDKSLKALERAARDQRKHGRVSSDRDGEREEGRGYGGGRYDGERQRGAEQEEGREHSGYNRGYGGADGPGKSRADYRGAERGEGRGYSGYSRESRGADGAPGKGRADYRSAGREESREHAAYSRAPRTYNGAEGENSRGGGPYKGREGRRVIVKKND